MDPNANLKEQEELLQEMSEYEADGAENHPAYKNAADDLGRYRAQLRRWLSNGGVEPDWSTCPNAAKHYNK
ncbi:MAG: hypothetical protein LC723_12225 [Actinobacteria bacterium]|nr:hypothetical protein [Actinomycetota bacterium]